MAETFFDLLLIHGFIAVVCGIPICLGIRWLFPPYYKPWREARADD